MWAKIAAGLAAALAVVGVGVYVAMPPTDGGCCGSKKTSAPAPECGLCSGGMCQAVQSDGCPNGPPVPSAPAVDQNALAACTGGTVIQPPPTAKIACCSE